MLWLLLAFLTAFFRSIQDVISKKVLSIADEYLVAFGSRFVAVIFLIPVLIYEINQKGFPNLTPAFWIAITVSGAANVLTMVLYMKALKVSDLSLALPMLTFTPLFLLITSPIMIGEWPDMSGFLGVLSIVLGSYLLNASKWKEGYFAPFKALLHQRGPQLMITIAFIWSITSNVDKMGLNITSAIFWSIALNIAMSAGLFPLMLMKSKTRVRKEHLKAFFWIGLAAALTTIFHMSAIELANVSYVIAIKRLSVLFGVVFGYLLFKEKDFKERLTGASFMVAGVALISVF